MKNLTTNPYIIGGIISILAGVLVYFIIPQYSFTMYGIPITTAVLAIAGLAGVYIGMKK